MCSKIGQGSPRRSKCLPKSILTYLPNAPILKPKISKETWPSHLTYFRGHPVMPSSMHLSSPFMGKKLTRLLLASDRCVIACRHIILAFRQRICLFSGYSCSDALRRVRLLQGASKVNARGLEIPSLWVGKLVAKSSCSYDARQEFYPKKKHAMQHKKVNFPPFSYVVQ